MGKFIFNPFTQNFTVIPKPPTTGAYQLVSQNGELGWVAGERYVKKATDQVVTNSTTLVNDNDLKFPVYELKSYYFVANIEFTSGSMSDIKLAFTVPTGAILRWGPINGMKVDPSGSVVVQGQETTSGASMAFGYAAAGGSRQLITVAGYVECDAGESGDLQLRWAQNTASSAEPTTVRSGSSLKVLTL